MDSQEVNTYLAEADILDLFMKQLVKDFQGAGLPAALELSSAEPAAIRHSVKRAVEMISRGGQDPLQRLLYRIDISEAQLVRYKNSNPERGFEEVVSELIIMRVLQKVILKKRFSDG